MRTRPSTNPPRSFWLRRPLLISIILFWSFCIAPSALADTVILTSPSNLVVIPISNNQINLTWSDNSSNEAGYTVERRIGSDNYTVIANLVANSTTYTDSGLTGGITYTYRVLALGNGSNISNSGYSAEAGATTTGAASSNYLATPGNLAATVASGSQINLNWIDYATGESTYSVERAISGSTFSVIAYLSANSQTFSDVGVVSGNTYNYRVQAIGDGSSKANSAYSNIASAVPGGTSATALGAPTGLTATAVTGVQVNLSWVDNASGETGYNVERCVGSSGKYTLTAYLGPNATSFSDTGLTANTAYTYRVQVRDSAGNYAYSNEATVTLGTQVHGVLTPPSYILATPVSGSQINLIWTDNSSSESGYNVERRTSDGTYSIVAYLAADIQSYSDLGLQEGVTYTYRIQTRGNGLTVADSAYSTEVSATTPQAAKPIVLRFFIGRMYYYLNDEGQFMDTAPIIQSNRTLLPITYAALPLGIEVDWNQKEQKVTLTRQGRVIQLWIGKNTALVNGVNVAIDAKNTKVVPTVIKGRTMVPLAFVAQSLDCQVDWDAKAQEVKITYPKP